MTKHDILSYSIHLYDSEITGFVKVKIDRYVNNRVKINKQ